MKPLRIKMQAFGPYLHATECDFSPLYGDRLFLIAGPTGCGKTTILDAMSFALYGSATGDLRAFRDMRSTRAPDTLDTEVVYEFSLGDTQYRFMRTVHIHKKRSGETEARVTGECSVCDGGQWRLLASGAEATSKQALELLHFTHSQFSQVIVLPQGEFRRLLLASSREKLEILQVLFALTRWQRITEGMQQRLKSLRDTLGQSFQQQAALLESAGVSSVQELEARLAETQAQYDAAKAAAEKAAMDLAAAQQAEAVARRAMQQFSELEAVRTEQTELMHRTPEMDAAREQLIRYDRFGRLIPMLRQTEQAQHEAARAAEQCAQTGRRYCESKEALRTAQEAADAVVSLREKERSLRDELARLSQLLPELDRLGEYRNALEEQLTQRDTAEQERTAAETALAVLDARVEKGTRYLAEQFETYLKPRAGWLEEKSATAQALARLEQYTRLRRQVQERTAALTAAQAQEKRAAAELSAAQRACERAQALLQQDAAHHLALSLAEGEPCPVCGAQHHPAPAGAAAGVPDVKELEAGNALLARCREASEAAISARAQAAALLDGAQQELDALKADGGLPEEPQETLRARLAELEEKIEAAQKSEAQYETLSGKLAGLKEKRAQAASIAQAAATRKAELESGISALRATVDEVLRKLPEGADAATLRKQHRDLQAQADTLRAQADTLERTLHEAQNACAAAAAAHTAAQQAQKNAQDASARAQQELAAACADAGTTLKEAAAAHPVSAQQADALRQALQTFETRKAFCARRMQELEAALRGLTPQMLEEKITALEAVRQAHSRAVEASAALGAQTDLQRGTLEKIQSLSGSRDALEQEYGQVCRVAEFCAGKNANRTPLSNFVLGLILDDVMQAASRYLQKLSRGRYALVRVDVENAAALHGLDIEVTDAHTGGQRKVCTLSGGELFLASLSLAFGLAEVVQSYAGGIQLDSIFIDEGFGSLDTETLDAAMRALADIQREGRLVGIISHVAELRARIPARIEVSPAPDGSTISVIPA